MRLRASAKSVRAAIAIAAGVVAAAAGGATSVEAEGRVEPPLGHESAPATIGRPLCEELEDLEHASGERRQGDRAILAWGEKTAVSIRSLSEEHR